MLFFIVVWPTCIPAEQIAGKLVFGHEVHTMQPCGSDQVYWLSISGPINGRLAADYQQLISKPYQAVYAVIDGDFAGPLNSGFAADYAGLIKITKVHSLVLQIPELCSVQADADKKVYVFFCDNKTRYTVEVSAKTAWLFRPEGTRKLVAVKGKEDGVYGDDIFTLQINGQQATLLEQGGQAVSCRNDAKHAIWEKAKLSGADFRAVGNEPPWHLEIYEGRRIVLHTGYENSRHEFSQARLVTDRSARTSRWLADGLVLEIAGKKCHDTMSDDTYETTVTVDWNGKILNGCGRALH